MKEYEENMTLKHITGIILAGGQASRMGGIDKGLLNLAGQPLIEHVINRLQPQLDQIVISANRNLSAYSRYCENIVTDSFVDYAGPLAGILAAMRQVKTDYILIVPCDCPFPPLDLAVRMINQLSTNGTLTGVAHDGTRIQPLFALLPVSLSNDLADFLTKGERKAQLWLTRHHYSVVDFSDQPEAFFNVNTPADHLELDKRARS